MLGTEQHIHNQHIPRSQETRFNLQLNDLLSLQEERWGHGSLAAYTTGYLVCFSCILYT